MDEAVRDHTGRVIYTTRSNGGQTKSVFDGSGSYIGSTDSRGTFDSRGRRVSPQDAPGLLKRGKS